MNAEVIVSCNSEGVDVKDTSVFLPTQEQLDIWASAAVRAATFASNNSDEMELSVAYVDPAGMRELNKQFRDTDRPTNVLSFSALEDLVDPALEVTGLLGDVVLCPKIIQDEALTQGKPVEHHFAHLLIHGVLHLSGMDHHAEIEAQAMEQAEIQILSSLDIPDPYNSVFTQ